MKNLLLTIAYDGTDFRGWQRQPSQRTVQGLLESVLSNLCNQDIELEGTSRTDTGVHALGQRATLKGDIKIPVANLPKAVNNILGETQRRSVGDVMILEAEEVEEGFHARFDAVGKTYLYRIRYGGHPDVMERNRCYHIEAEPNITLMKKAAESLVGELDFRSFMASGGKEPNTTVRNIFNIRLHERTSYESVMHISDNSGYGNIKEIILEITGDGFLYNMVRIITGTLIDIGTGRITDKSAMDIIEAKDRKFAGHTAPPQGLYLAEIYYDIDKMMEKAGGD